MPRGQYHLVSDRGSGWPRHIPSSPLSVANVHVTGYLCRPDRVGVAVWACLSRTRGDRRGEPQQLENQMSKPATSLTRDLASLVASAAVWRPIEPLDAPSSRVMDVVVTETARSHLRTINAAVAHLAEPARWARLRDAAVASFPNNPARRLSPTPPTRHRHYTTRQQFTSEVIDAWRRGVRREAADVALRRRDVRPRRGHLDPPRRHTDCRGRHDVDTGPHPPPHVCCTDRQERPQTGCHPQRR